MHEDVASTIRYVAKTLTSLESDVTNITVVVGYPTRQPMQLQHAALTLGLILRGAMARGDIEALKYVRDELLWRFPTTKIPGETMSIPIGGSWKQSYDFTITTYTLGLMLGGCIQDLAA